MLRTQPPFRAEHVGSLLRPPALKQARRDRAEGRIDAAKLRALMDADCELGYKVMQATAKVIASRLTHTRIILVGERGLSHLTDY